MVDERLARLLSPVLLIVLELGADVNDAVDVCSLDEDDLRDEVVSVEDATVSLIRAVLDVGGGSAVVSSDVEGVSVVVDEMASVNVRVISIDVRVFESASPTVLLPLAVCEVVDVLWEDGTELMVGMLVVVVRDVVLEAVSF